MTSPTIIQQPGALDQFAAAALQGYQIGNQLARQRQQLDLERRRTESQINLQGEQAGEARAAAKHLDAQSQDLEAQLQGHALASGVTTFLNDEGRIAQFMDGHDPAAVGYARTFIDQMRGAAANVAHTQADTEELQQRIAAQKRDTDENNRIGQLIATTDSSSPNALAALARRIGTINPAKMAMVEALQPKGNYTFFHGPDGQLYIGDTKRGTATRTEYNVGQPQQNSVRANQQKLAAGTAYNALQALHQIVLKYGPEATGIPVAASAAQGIANFGVGNIKPFGGLAGPAAQRLRSQVQQDAANYHAMFVHSFATALGGYRSMGLMTSMGTAYAAQSGQDPKTLLHLDNNRMNVGPALISIMRGEPIDITKLPGFDVWGKDFIAEQQGQGEAGAAPEATDEDLQSYALPRQP